MPTVAQIVAAEALRPKYQPPSLKGKFNRAQNLLIEFGLIAMN